MNGFAQLAAMKARLRRLPMVQEAVAVKAAPAVTGLAQASYSAGVSVYGDPRPPRKDGSTMTLHKTGKLQADVRFVPRGTKIGARLMQPYSKFFIRYGILPRGGASLPSSWDAAIKNVAQAEITAHMRAA